MAITPTTHIEKVIAGEVEPVSHLEKSIAGIVEPVTHLEKVIDQYGGGSGGGEAVLIPKTITENGAYDPAEDNADGYSSVTVNVPGVKKATGTFTLVSDGRMPEIVHNLGTQKIAAIIWPAGPLSASATYHEYYDVFVNAPAITGDSDWSLDFSGYHSGFSEPYLYTSTERNSHLRLGNFGSSPYSTQTNPWAANNNTTYAGNYQITDNTFKRSPYTMMAGTYNYEIVAFE